MRRGVSTILFVMALGPSLKFSAGMKDFPPERPKVKLPSKGPMKAGLSPTGGLYRTTNNKPTLISSPTSNEIKFYDRLDPYYEFTNFYRRPVTIDSKVWPSTEHYFQAQKFIGTPYVEYIRKLSTPREAFKFSREPRVQSWIRRDWSRVKDDVMKLALLHKFDQHEDLRRCLLGTGDKVLVEHTSNDNYWGDGGDGSGQNKLGHLLMEIRKTMRLKYNMRQPPDRPTQGSLCYRSQSPMPMKASHATTGYWRRSATHTSQKHTSTLSTLLLPKRHHRSTNYFHPLPHQK